MTPLPVTVLTGFLGAGKTTFLARTLRENHGLRIGLVINEIGVAGTDGIAMSEAEYLELTEGCVCCTRNPDLIAALAEYAARGDLDRVIIETTGVADPLALTFVLERPDVAKLARLDAVVTVVDAANWRLTAEQPEWQAQIATADLLVVTKIDLASDDLPALEAHLQSANPVARVFTKDVPLSVLLDAGDGSGAGPEAGAGTSSEMGPAPRHSGFVAVSIVTTTPYRANDLEDLLETLPLTIYRAKGVVARDDGRWMSFHVVAGRLQLDLGVPAPAHGESRIVLIGHDLDREALAALFAECAA